MLVMYELSRVDRLRDVFVNRTGTIQMNYGQLAHPVDELLEILAQDKSGN